jgi:uncharacterized membrane protein YdjX (TVP38/TMEM64 family)
VKLFAAIVAGAWTAAFAVTRFTLRDTATSSSSASLSDIISCEAIATMCFFVAFIVLYAQWCRRRFIAGRTPKALGISWRQWVLASLIALCPMVLAYFALGAYDARGASTLAQRSLFINAVTNLALAFNLLLMIQRVRAFDPQTDLRAGVSTS